jgi:hypothetical protein
MRRLALLVIPLALMACGSDDGSTGATTPPSTSVSDPTFTTVPRSITPVTPTVSPAVTAGPQPSDPSGGTDVQRAIADLASRQGVDPSAIMTVSVDEVTWPDGSIGCPQPGMSYAQALVAGVRVLLELDGRRYEYHAGEGRPIFLCETPQPPVGG